MIIADGHSYVGYNPTIEPWEPDQDSIAWANTATDTGPVFATAVQTNDIICHLNATNAPISADATAGQNITLHWTPWPDSHHGPIMRIARQWIRRRSNSSR